VETDNGVFYSFREDVKTANKTPVYPDEETLRERFLNKEITNITFIFVPGDSKINGYYSAWGIEFAFKLTKFYNSINYVYGEANILGQSVDSIDNVTDDPTNLKLIIVPFNQTTENKIVVDGNRVYIYGRDEQEIDYAVIKTILVALGNWTLAK
jgi:hypothetical protein